MPQFSHSHNHPQLPRIFSTLILIPILILTLIYSFTHLLGRSVAHLIHAQTTAPFNLGIAPPSSYWHIKPGNEVTHTIILKNEGAFTLNITPQLVNFKSDQRTGTPVFEEKSFKNTSQENNPIDSSLNSLTSRLLTTQDSIKPINPTTSPAIVTDSNIVADSKLPTSNPKSPLLAPYITILNPDFTWHQSFPLKPGEEKKIALKIAPPTTEPNLNPDSESNSPISNQEHHMTVLFTGSPAFSAPTTGSTTKISGIVGSNLIVFVSSQDNDLSKLEIAKLNVPRIVGSFNKISFSVLAKNSGRNATPNTGKAWISSLSNQKLSEYIFYPDMVLANSTREVRGLPTSLLENIDKEKLGPEELAQLTSQFSYKPPFLFGIYTLTVNLGEETRAIRLIALPFSLIILGAVGSVVYVVFKKLKI